MTKSGHEGMNHELCQVAFKAGTNPAGGREELGTLDHSVSTLTVTTVLRNYTILSA